MINLAIELADLATITSTYSSKMHFIDIDDNFLNGLSMLVDEQMYKVYIVCTLISSSPTHAESGARKGFFSPIIPPFQLYTCADNFEFHIPCCHRIVDPVTIGKFMCFQYAIHFPKGFLKAACSTFIKLGPWF